MTHTTKYILYDIFLSLNGITPPISFCLFVWILLSSSIPSLYILHCCCTKTSRTYWEIRCSFQVLECLVQKILASVRHLAKRLLSFIATISLNAKLFSRPLSSPDVFPPFMSFSALFISSPAVIGSFLIIKFIRVFVWSLEVYKSL